MVVLPSNHRLAAIKSIGPSDLTGERFVTVSNTAPVRAQSSTVFLSPPGSRSGQPTRLTIYPWECH
jgi:hypothetical protein